MKLYRDTFEALGFDLDQAIADYRQALADHTKTVGVPAPRAHIIVEQIVKGDGVYEVVEPPLPKQPELPTVEPSVEDIAAMKRKELFMADPQWAELANLLNAPTPADIDRWLNDNLTGLTEVRTLLGALLKLMAGSPPRRSGT